MNWTHTWGVFKPQQCNRCCVESQEATRLLASTFAMAMIDDDDGEDSDGEDSTFDMEVQREAMVVVMGF